MKYVGLIAILHLRVVTWLANAPMTMEMFTKYIYILFILVFILTSLFRFGNSILKLASSSMLG
jgi:hypothetical protein